MSERVHVSESGLSEAMAGLSRYEREVDELCADLARVMAEAERACSDDVQTCERTLRAAQDLEVRSRGGQAAPAARSALAVADEGLRRARKRMAIVLSANQTAKAALSRHHAGRQQALDRGRALASRSAEQVGNYLNVQGTLGRVAVNGASGIGPSSATAAALGRAALSDPDPGATAAAGQE